MFTTLQFFSELWAIYATGSHMITDKDSSLLCCDALFFGESKKTLLVLPDPQDTGTTNPCNIRHPSSKDTASQS